MNSFSFFSLMLYSSLDEMFVFYVSNWMNVRVFFSFYAKTYWLCSMIWIRMNYVQYIYIYLSIKIKRMRRKFRCYKNPQTMARLFVYSNAICVFFALWIHVNVPNNFMGFYSIDAIYDVNFVQSLYCASAK